MLSGINFKLKVIKRYEVFFIILVFMLLCFSYSAMAGLPLGGKDGIVLYNVLENGFSIIWQVDTESSCTVRLFEDKNGTIPIDSGSYTVSAGISESQILGLSRGIMQVDVIGLFADTNYFVQTVSSYNSQEFAYPDFGDLLYLRTEPSFTAFPPNNGFVFFKLYNDNGVNPSDPDENLISDGVVAVVYATTATQRANYPLSTSYAGSLNGFPSEGGRYNVSLGSFRSGRNTDDNYWRWDNTQDYNLKIICFGGEVPGVGFGKRIINTTFSRNWVGMVSDCLSNVDGCAVIGGTKYSQIILMHNQPPSLALPAFDAKDPYDASIWAYFGERNQQFNLEVCANDPEGDPITGYSLEGDVPSGMALGAHSDPNCTYVNWTPPADAGAFYRNIRIVVSDGSNSSDKNITVIILNSPPSKPQAALTPAQPFTNNNITCSVTPGSVVNPDSSDTTYLDFRWYKANPETLIHSDIDIIFNPANSATYNRVLNSGLTQKGDVIYCKVTARDKDGDLGPAETSHVTVLNTLPSKPNSAQIAAKTGDPDAPTTTVNLTCTIVPGPSDLDGDTVTHKFDWSAGSKSYSSNNYIAGNTHELPASETAKGETWICRVTAWDGEQQSSTYTQSNSLTIRNTPPNTPVAAVITPTDPDGRDDLRCNVTPASPPDIDSSDAAAMRYEYVWSCTACGGKASITHGPKAGTFDILNSGETGRDQQWSCVVRAVDGSDAYSPQVTASAVTIANTPPAGLDVEVKAEGAAQVDPNGNVYITDNLVCTVIAIPDDPDNDTITYTYRWQKAGSGTVAREQTKTATFDTLPKTELLRGDLWYCEVTASDGTDEVTDTSNQVYVFNRSPQITTSPSETTQDWNENTEYIIEGIGSDPDGDDLTYELDTNYIYPGAPAIENILELSFNTDTGILTALPLSGSSSEDVGYGQGVFKFNIIVRDIMRPGEDQVFSKTSKKLIQAEVKLPCITLDDFEYPSNKPNLTQNGWYWLQGVGSMLLKTDPNTANHYFQTTVSPAPTNNSQLKYIVTKRVDQEVYTNSELHFFIKDKNLYYFEAYIRAFKNDGSEANYFLRYVPENPKDTFTVSGNYVTWKIGQEFIDSNGREVVRNMETDISQAKTGWHFKYLKGLLVRGDTDYLDNIILCQGAVDRKAPKEVLDLKATVGNKKITLTWQLDPNQDEDIAGYYVYISSIGHPDAIPGNRIVQLPSTAVSYQATKTASGADLVNGTKYYLRVTAVDSSPAKNESTGKLITGTPGITPLKPPADLVGESVVGAIELTWKNPTGQSADIYGYVIYYCLCKNTDCSGCYSKLVEKSAIDPNGNFVVNITKDAQGNPLTYGSYHFTVKARDNASPTPNYSTGEEVSVPYIEPASSTIDDFEPSLTGWYKYQGNGIFKRELETGNYYLRVQSGYSGQAATNYVIAKSIKDPQKNTNPELSIKIRSAGFFRIDAYLKGSNNKNYFISYNANPAVTTDSGPVTPAGQTSWFVYTLGWANYKNIWTELRRNLNDDLLAATNGAVEYSYLMGLIVRGTLDIDNIKLFQTLAEIQNLTARARNLSVSLSGTIVQPDIVDNVKIYINGTPTVLSLNELYNEPGTDDYEYTVSGLNNNTEYQFRVALVLSGQESNGVLIKATPRAFHDPIETFDDLFGWVEGWGQGITPVPDYGYIYDSEVQSNVMYLDTDHQYPERFYLSKDMDVSGITNMSLRIKSQQNTNFIIWVDTTDKSGLPFWLGIVSGGTKNTYKWHGWFGYYYLGSEYTSGKWNYINLNLDSILNTILSFGLDSVNGISLGGNIRVDDLAFY